MISAIQNTPPEVALMLGFFLSQGLEKSAKQGLIAKLLPWVEVQKEKKKKDSN